VQALISKVQALYHLDLSKITLIETFIRVWAQNSKWKGIEIMWKYVLVGVLAIGLMSFGVRFATQALFTDTQSVGSNTFSTGTVDISSSPTTALITFSAMSPGDKVTDTITVTNTGTLALRYAVKSTTTENTLAAQLDLTIKTGVTTCTNAGFGTDGTVRYGPADLGSSTGVNLIGDPTQGGQSGDRYLSGSSQIVDADGTFPAGAGADAPTNEVFCFQLQLPQGTANSFQNLTTTATFAFEAEQRANN